MTDMEKLLEEGRRLLAVEKEAKDASDSERRAELEEIFEGARLLAKERFDAIPGIVPILPEEMPEDFNQDGNGVTFYIQPFGHVRIEVSVGIEYGMYDYDKRMYVEPNYIVGKEPYSVGVAFGFRDDDKEPRCVSWESTGSLPKALALCELAEKEYNRVASEGNQQKSRKKSLSIEERFIGVLTEFIHSRMPEGE